VKPPPQGNVVVSNAIRRNRIKRKRRTNEWIMMRVKIQIHIKEEKRREREEHKLILFILGALSPQTLHHPNFTPYSSLKVGVRLAMNILWYCEEKRVEVFFVLRWRS
jgi:hypothetical protein